MIRSVCNTPEHKKGIWNDMERCSMHLLYIIKLRFCIRVIFDAYC